MTNRLTLPLADWVGSATLAQVSDAQLLHRFAKAGEQHAFAMLVKRHGPMVWGVARRLLRSHQDAEDTFQAAFLVLARKANSLRQPHLLASWLHGVAHRTALHVRSRTKVALPLEAGHEPAGATADHLAWQDCGLVIDRAIEQLPSSLRIVFLLCQAEGLTTLAAAKRLNMPEGTVVSRLHRARKQLQQLLARHGITSAAGAVAAAWCLALPDSLSAFTIRSILASNPPALIAGLAQGVLTTMMWIKLTTAAVIVSTVGLVGAGAATALSQGSGNKTATASGVQAQSREDRIKQLENQLAEAREREAVMRQQLEEQLQKSKAVQQFLQKSLLAETEQRDKAAAQEIQAKKNEQQRAQMEAEILVKRERDRQVAQGRRQQDLAVAREQLVRDIEKFHKSFMDLEEKLNQIAVEQQQANMKHDNIKQDIEKEARIVEQRYGAESEKMKELKAKRDAMVAEAAKYAAAANQKPSITQSLNRIQAQLKLREKLLIEVEEKLLRSQLKLDE